MPDERATPTLRARLLAGAPLRGTMLSLPSADVAELLDGLGFDWLFVDGEHGPFGARELLDVLRATPRTPCLVRTPVGDAAAIARALDCGAAGVIVPQVHDAATAARVTGLARFAPRGTRGVGVARANAYGARVRETLAAANEQVVVVVQAESAAAVANIDAIVRVDGVDAVLVGPYDLSVSLGHPGETDHPVVRDAIARVVDACRAAGRQAGIFGMGAAAIAPWAARGATLLVAGVDVVLLREAAARLRGEMDALGG